jgi:uncharacterized membrane protein
MFIVYYKMWKNTKEMKSTVQMNYLDSCLAKQCLIRICSSLDRHALCWWLGELVCTGIFIYIVSAGFG